MSSSYDVRVWSTRVYQGTGVRTFYVRWRVDRRQRNRSFATRALADSFRSQLVLAASRGEAFEVSSGLPVSMCREGGDMSWYTFACQYVDMRWSQVAATTRRTHAEALTAVTAALYTTTRGRPQPKLIRSALCRWGFNTVRRGDPHRPDDVDAALWWVQANTVPVSALSSPDVLRSVLEQLAVRLDGEPSAASVVSRRRKIFNAVLEYAVESKLLESNALPALKWKPAPAAATLRIVPQVDRRSVANPRQVRTLLEAVRAQRSSGPRLVAYFACLYFAALRPEEAAGLATHHLSLPPQGWGELHLQTAAPYAGSEWTDSGGPRDQRPLKQRHHGHTRTVPCPPELTAMLHDHVTAFGAGPGGRLFVGQRNRRQLPKLTIVRAWQRAREHVLTPQVAASPLAATPYDLRHAAVSTWLNAGVPAATVAQWAGHSVEILLKTYAKCLDGEAHQLHQRVQHALE